MILLYQTMENVVNNLDFVVPSNLSSLPIAQFCGFVVFFWVTNFVVYDDKK